MIKKNTVFEFRGKEYEVISDIEMDGYEEKTKKNTFYFYGKEKDADTGTYFIFKIRKNTDGFSEIPLFFPEDIKEITEIS